MKDAAAVVGFIRRVFPSDASKGLIPREVTIAASLSTPSSTDRWGRVCVFTVDTMKGVARHGHGDIYSYYCCALFLVI